MVWSRALNEHAQFTRSDFVWARFYWAANCKARATIYPLLSIGLTQEDPSRDDWKMLTGT